jgi:pimeloyl-ACP methyl ester carboxylesterase
MRAREPDASGFVERGDVRVWWERFGEGDPAILFFGGDAIVESRMWKAQVPWFARRNAVVTFDPPGNGRSTRTTDPAALADEELLGFALATLDAAGVGRVIAAGVCSGAGLSVMLAAEHPDRVAGVVAINPGIVLTPAHPHRRPGGFDSALDHDDGWAKENRHYWKRDWPGYAEFFFDQLLPEPHSTKQHEDAVEWACGTTAEVMLGEVDKVLPSDRTPSVRFDPESAAALCRRVRCPVLVINGDLDMCQPPARSRRVAELTGGELLVLEGAGHLPHARDPVKINLEIDRFVRRVAGGTYWRALSRRMNVSPAAR